MARPITFWSRKLNRRRAVSLRILRPRTKPPRVGTHVTELTGMCVHGSTKIVMQKGFTAATEHDPISVGNLRSAAAGHLFLDGGRIDERRILIFGADGRTLHGSKHL